MTDEWTPQVGEKVRLVVRSAIGAGRLIRDEACAVTKVTSAGYVYLDKRSDKFRRSGPTTFSEWRPKRYGSRQYHVTFSKIEEQPDV